MSEQNKVKTLPVEVQLALEVMPCQAMRDVYDKSDEAHPCSYFSEWGYYHSFDYETEGPPAQPGIVQSSVYVGKRALLPEILSGCRKAPIMAVGINPNLPGYWSPTRNAVNPYFDDYLQYAHYFRYRSTAKLQITKQEYQSLRGTRQDAPSDPTPLTETGAKLDLELTDQKMYLGYQELLAGLAAKFGWGNHKLSIGEDLSYGNMVACPSAKWVIQPDSKNPDMPVMGSQRAKGIVNECFFERRYFLRQLFQSLPSVLIVLSETTKQPFLMAMKGNFIEGSPKPSESNDELLKRVIRLRYGTTPDGDDLTARVIFSPHASANPEGFEKAKERMIEILSEEVNAGRLTYNKKTGHLARPLGACTFCSNALYKIGDCDYEKEITPLAVQPQLLAATGSKINPVVLENSLQAEMLDEFLQNDSDGGIAKLGLAPAEIKVKPVDPPTSPKMVLRGKIVTMDRNLKVIDKGLVYMNAGSIEAVRSSADAVVAGYEECPQLDANGLIFPGLFDLHNHLAYNVLPLWAPPKKFTNRTGWMARADYKASVSSPLNLLAGQTSTAKAIARYVETKALISGTCATQGMRSRQSGLQAMFSGSVRNFENTGDVSLPEAGTKILNLKPHDEGDIESFRSALAKVKAYFYHLAEGTDNAARQTFLDLKQNELLEPTLVGIHCLGLKKSDLETFASVGSHLVWSPFSNCLLYGQTLDIDQIRQFGINFGIGCDWSPTGSKNILEEAKIAYLAAKAAGSSITYAELCQALTLNAATLVNWQQKTGSLEDGKYADLIVIDDPGINDPYEALVKCTERNVKLVLINGYPRYGDESLMKQLVKPSTLLESLKINGRKKAFYFQQSGSPLDGISFSNAKSTLSNAMANLKEFAEHSLASAFSFVENSQSFQLILDNEEHDERQTITELAVAAIPPKNSISLDAIAVEEDEQHLKSFSIIQHLPIWIHDLPNFYKKS